MILKTLRLKNFRKFKDTLIEFPDGVTGIIGLNGAGKSTIFEAIAWALYGPTAARTSAEHIKTQQATTKEPCRIELDFTLDSDTYHLMRQMTGKTHTASATITKNNTIAAEGADTVTHYIHKTLGMDFKSFYTSIFAKQKELNALSQINPSERRPLILRMLGITQIDTIITTIRSDQKTKKETVQHLQHNLTDESGKLKILTYQQQQKHLQNQHKTQKKQIQTIQQDIKTQEDTMQEAHKLTQQKKTTYERTLKQKETLEQQKTHHDKKNQLKKEIETIQEHLNKRNHAIDTYQQQLNKYPRVELELQALKDKQHKNTHNISELSKQQEQLHQQQKTIQQQQNETQQKKQHIKKLGPNATCPTCQRPLKEHYQKLLHTYQQDIDSFDKKYTTLTKKNKTYKEKQDRLEKEKQALEKKYTYLQQQYIKKEKLHTTIQQITKEKESETQQIKNKQQELDKTKDLRFNKQQYQTIQQNITTCYQEWQKASEHYETLREKRETYRLQLKQQEGDLKLIEEQIKNLNTTIEEQKKLQNTLKNEQQNLQQLSTLSQIMSSFRTYLISQIRPAMSHYASELYTQLTDGKYPEIELDENYNLLIYDQGTAHTINRYSGGEEDLANLCIRLAISEVLTERSGNTINFIILDEIFGSQDINRRQNIIYALHQLSAKFRQIFLITHISDLKNEMEHTIFVEEDNNGISTAKLE